MPKYSLTRTAKFKYRIKQKPFTPASLRLTRGKYYLKGKDGRLKVASMKKGTSRSYKKKKSTPARKKKSKPKRRR